MKNNKAIDAADFINEFYNLFSRYDNDCYVGSKEQARLLIQLKLKLFIPKRLIDSAFNIFISSKLIEKLDRNIEHEIKIGDKFFRKTFQSVYKKIGVSNEKDILKNIESAFLNINEIVSELPSKSDIKRLRTLEKSKEYVFRWEYRGKVRFIKYNNMTDTDLLYSFSKKDIESFISELESINIELEKEEKIIKDKKESLENEIFDSEFSSIMNKILEVLKTQLEHHKQIDVDVYMLPHEKVRFGSLIVTDIEILESQMNIKSNSFDISIHYSYNISLIDNKIGFYSHGLCYYFYINSQFKAELKIIDLLIKDFREERMSKGYY